MIHEIKKLKSIYISIVCSVIIIIFFIVDITTKEYLDFSVYYFLPIAITAWFAGRKHGLTIAAASSIAWIYSEWSIGTRYLETHSLITNSMLVIIADLFLVILMDRLRREMENSARRESLLIKNEAIVKVTQGICGIIAQHVAFHNSEIINWVNKKKNGGHQVSDKIENSSLAIGESVKTLVEASFANYDANNISDVDVYLNELEVKFNTEKNKKSKNKFST